MKIKKKFVQLKLYFFDLVVRDSEAPDSPSQSKQAKKPDEPPPDKKIMRNFRNFCVLY
jgi:hypothetical protein